MHQSLISNHQREFTIGRNVRNHTHLCASEKWCCRGGISQGPRQGFSVNFGAELLLHISQSKHIPNQTALNWLCQHKATAASDRCRVPCDTPTPVSRAGVLRAGLPLCRHAHKGASPRPPWNPSAPEGAPRLPLGGSQPLTWPWSPGRCSSSPVSAFLGGRTRARMTLVTCSVRSPLLSGGCLLCSLPGFAGRSPAYSGQIGRELRTPNSGPPRHSRPPMGLCSFFLFVFNFVI